MVEDRRSDSRMPVFWRGHLIFGEHCHPVMIEDVSTAGALVRSHVVVAQGAEVILHIAELGEFAGEVAWTRMGAIGLRLMAGPDLALKKFAESRIDAFAIK